MTTDMHFDAIVVGSGFGGSVTAYRLAEAGRPVLVLERGRPYPPGSFTRSPYPARPPAGGGAGVPRAGRRRPYPAGVLPPQPVPARRELLGPAARPHGHVPLLVVQGHRRAGVRRAGRRLAHLRQRVHPQGREVV